MFTGVDARLALPISLKNKASRISIFSLPPTIDVASAASESRLVLCYLLRASIVTNRPARMKGTVHQRRCERHTRRLIARVDCHDLSRLTLLLRVRLILSQFYPNRKTVLAKRAVVMIASAPWCTRRR